MILLSIIIGLVIISILARFGVFILNTILDFMSDNNTTEQTYKNNNTTDSPRKKKSNGCLYYIICFIILLIFILYLAYDQAESYMNSYRKTNHGDHSYSSSTESATPTSMDHSYRSPNERSYRWIYDADTGIGYHSGESQCSVLSLKQHAMGSSNPHWVTFMITKYTSGTVRLIVSDGIYDHIIGNQSVWIEFDHASPLSLTSSKDGVKLVMYTDGTMLTRMKASTRMTINVKLDNQTTETLEFDLSNFKTQCPY